MGLGEFADPTRDALNLIVLEQPLHAGSEVVRQRDFHIQFRIETAGARGPSDRVRCLDLFQESCEVGADLL